MPVSAKIILLGVEVGFPRTNTNYTTTSSSIMTPPTKIWCRIGPLFIWITHGWIFPTLRSHKITTISPKIKFLGGKVGVPRSYTTFNIPNNNIKWRTTQSNNWIFLTGRWRHWGCFKVTLRWTKSPIMPVFSKITFLEVEVWCTQKSPIKIVSTSSLSGECSFLKVGSF